MAMKLRYLAIACVAVAASVFGVSSQQKPADEVIKVNTTLVSVPVIVSDHNGRYVPGLKPEDFAILQDGIRQKIDFFAANEEPLSIALLIDTSESTSGVLENIKDSAKIF